MKKHSFLHGRTTVGERGQIVIPQDIRSALKIKAGQEMIVVSKGEKIVIFPADKLESFYRAMLSHFGDLRKSSTKSKKS